MSRAVSTAGRAAGCPHPRPPSTRAHAPPSECRSARALAITRPSRTEATYDGRRITPWESCPARLASTRDAATIAARSTGVPTASRIDWLRRCRSSARNRSPFSAAWLTASALVRALDARELDQVADRVPTEEARSVVDRSVVVRPEPCGLELTPRLVEVVDVEAEVPRCAPIGFTWKEVQLEGRTGHVPNQVEVRE